ncbi:MAG: 30S ribosomal protein S20 [Candidatus Wildermuthbacteria bacterium RIFCSPHIGHO2_02_FULL_49_9]|uniref:Small ribosomal subunit protein bS20 n=2 Tax=Candidatus Wildermuthiibacteriota TaxID=1817923 RepID=A0A1G2QXB3_9BACT|nr:MAG: 30S ribosomal protein S20 [Candidatus Wildermuthbacteria bacterium RIFCSPHIGHO2_01_FULL_49_22b]OHA70409.1 MAG: 30S ribosomal protein S20 [Candidatus Wildermuthbacteria bacterium RIFCSPHIGHO2_02_FULL_49_9]
MPITKSAKKALRQNIRGKIRNLKRKNAVKELVKQTRKLALAGQKEEAVRILPRLYQALDKAAKRGIIKKNAAARKKSRLTKLLLKNSV